MSARLAGPFDKAHPRMDCLAGRIIMDGKPLTIKEAEITAKRWEREMNASDDPWSVSRYSAAISDAVAAVDAACCEADHVNAMHRRFAALGRGRR